MSKNGSSSRGRGARDPSRVLCGAYRVFKKVEDKVWRDYLRFSKLTIRVEFESKNTKIVGNGRTFPLHLSVALLSIVKNRAVVSDILGTRCRPLSGGTSYERQALQESCDELLQCVCELSAGRVREGRKVVTTGVELKFLIGVLERHASPEQIRVSRRTLKYLIDKMQGSEWTEASDDLRVHDGPAPTSRWEPNPGPVGTTGAQGLEIGNSLDQIGVEAIVEVFVLFRVEDPDSWLTRDTSFKDLDPLLELLELLHV